jgi:AP-3 complex subunit delta-1
MTHRQRSGKRAQYPLFIYETCLPYPTVSDIPIFPRLPVLNGANPIESRLPSLRTTVQTFSSQSFVVDKEGEMPEGAVVPVPQPASTSDRAITPSQFTSFPQSDHIDSPPRSQTPDPITVVRTKKKRTGGKKRTAPTPTS